uniref:Uncharacterized protein n=1 Tax=Triticum urartu TaxID=4572 RepID=A0A8R7TZL3_TRIUA
MAPTRPRRSRGDDHLDGRGVGAPGPPAAAPGGGRAAEHRVPAGGAGVVRDEPGVDAADVELVAAARQHAHLLAVLELAEADGADVVRRRGAAPARGRARAVHLDGEAPERALLEPAPPARRRRRRRAVQLPAARRLQRRAPRPPDDVPREGVEPQREEQGEEQRGEDDDHVGVEAGVAAAAAAERALRAVLGARRRLRARLAHVPAHGPGVRAHRLPCRGNYAPEVWAPVARL